VMFMNLLGNAALTPSIYIPYVEVTEVDQFRNWNMEQNV